MKRIIIALLLLFPVLVSAQGHKGSVEACSPMKNGKIYYEDQVDMDGMSQMGQKELWERCFPLKCSYKQEEAYDSGQLDG